MTAKEFLISIKDDDGLWPSLQADCDQLLHLRDVPFKCTALSATRMIEIFVKFAVTKDTGLSSETGALNWQRMPFVCVYVFKCEDPDAYKSGLSTLKQWIDVMNDKNQEWLVLYFPQGSSNNTFSATSAKYRKIWEKLRGDIKPVDRLCKHDLNSGKASEFVIRTRDALVSSIDARISVYEKAAGAILTLGRQTEGWCPSTWILAKDTVAQLFERLGLTSQALSVLDEISNVVDNPTADIPLKFPFLVRDHCSLNILETNSVFFRELLKNDHASEVDARQYLFSRRFALFENLHRSADAASLSVRLCRFFFKRLYLLLPSKSAHTNPLFPFSWAIELCDAVSGHLADSVSSGAEDTQSKQTAIICAELLLFARELLCTFELKLEHSDPNQSSMPLDPIAVREMEYVRSHDLAALVRERSISCTSSSKTQLPVESFDDEENKTPSEFTHRLPLKPSAFSIDIQGSSTFKELASTLGFGLLASALSSKQALLRTKIEVSLRAAYFYRMAGRYRSVCLLYKEIGEAVGPIDAGIGASFLLSCVNVWVEEGWVTPILSAYPLLFAYFKKLESIQPLANLCVKLLSSRLEFPPSLFQMFQSELIECVTSFNAVPMVTGLPDIFQILPLVSSKDEISVRSSEKCNFSICVASLAAQKFPIDVVTMSFSPVLSVTDIAPASPLPHSSPSRLSTSNPASPATALMTTPRAALETASPASVETSNQISLHAADIELSNGLNNCVLSGNFPSSGHFVATSIMFQIGVLKMVSPLQNQVPPFIINVRETKVAASISFSHSENVCAGFWNYLCLEISSGVLEDVEYRLQIQADCCEFFNTGLIVPGPHSLHLSSAHSIASSECCQKIKLNNENGHSFWSLSSMLASEYCSLCVCFKTMDPGPCSIVATLNATSDDNVVFSVTNRCNLNVVDCVSAQATVSQGNQSVFVSVELQSRHVAVDLVSSAIQVPGNFSVDSDLSSGLNLRPLLPGQLLGLGAKIGLKPEVAGPSNCIGRILLRLMPVDDVRKDLGLLETDFSHCGDDEFSEVTDDNNPIEYVQEINLPCVTKTLIAEVVAPKFSSFGRQDDHFALYWMLGNLTLNSACFT